MPEPVCRLCGCTTDRACPGAYSLDTVRPIIRRNINPFALSAFENAMLEI